MTAPLTPDEAGHLLVAARILLTGWTTGPRLSRAEALREAELARRMGNAERAAEWDTLAYSDGSAARAKVAELRSAIAKLELQRTTALVDQRVAR